MRRAFVVVAINDDLHILVIYKTVATLHNIRNTSLSWTMKSGDRLFEYMACYACFSPSDNWYRMVAVLKGIQFGSF